MAMKEQQALNLGIQDLPQEIHLLITSHLIYPDALSLKHTNRYFYSFLDDELEDLQIEWLIQRRQLHLNCPNDSKCQLGSDVRFCRGSAVLLMKRRRDHQECDDRPGGRGCLVFGRNICLHKKNGNNLTAILRYLKMRNYLWVVVVVMVALLAIVTGQTRKSPIMGER